jgi:protoheme IX farnesyltransferase
MRMAGDVYFAGALVLSIAFLVLTIRFARTRATREARQVFFGSIIYLPLLWILMIANKI